MNQFLTKLKQCDAKTWNGALSNSTSGSACLDYFSKMGSFRGRTNNEVASSMGSIFGEDPLLATKLVFFNRLITRKPKGFNNESDVLHKGSGNKDEFIRSLNWLHNNYPDILYKNLWLVPVISRWSDLWYYSPVTKLTLDIDKTEVYKLIKTGLASDYHRGLICKHLPKIRSRRNTKNDRHRWLNTFARGLCEYLGINETQYRKLKSDPDNTAHLWQRQMCNNDWNDINFDLIPGKALFALLSQKGKDRKNAIERHNLEQKYLEWIKKQPVAKFTGYPYELYKAARSGRSLIQKYTYDAQFDGLIAKAKESVPSELLEKGVLCALDTSGSMSSSYYMGGIQDVGLAPIDVCVGLGIYFASLIEGYFHNHVIMFDDTSKFLKLQGESFCDKVDQISRQATAWGGTNFSSIIAEILRVRCNHPEIPVEDYPEVILVCSDMQFSIAGDNTKTNYEWAVEQFKSAGLNPPIFIWWMLNAQFTGDVPVLSGDNGNILISGFDPAIVTTLLGGTEKIIDKETGELRNKNPLEMMNECLDQEILNKIQI